MDFISNLIKRPISLVRSDSLPPTPTNQEGQQAASTSSRPTTPQHPQPTLLPFVRATTPESQQQQHIANALNGCLVASNIMDTLNIRDEFRPIAVAVATAATRVSPPISRQSLTPPLLSRSLQGSIDSGSGSGVGGGSNPSTTTGNTIEELLIQINDNLNLGDLHSISAELSQQHLPNRPLSLSPSALRQAMSSEYNAICTKSANLKGTSSSQSQESLPSTTLRLQSAAMAPVADNASATNILASEPNHREIEAKAVPLKTETNVDKANTQADDTSETKISEMPTALNLNTEDQAKLTFEDGLIPTLTAAINEHEKNECAPEKDKSNHKPNQHLQLNVEPDTAASSDNEIFAECQSYQVMGADNTYGFMADEFSFENSEVESYFSAANSRNATLTNIGADPLSLSINKISEQCDSDQGDLQSMLSALSGDEMLAPPIDVDVNFSELKEQIKIVEDIKLPITNVPNSIHSSHASQNVVEESEFKNHQLVMFNDEPMDVDVSFSELNEQIKVVEDNKLPIKNVSDETLLSLTANHVDNVVKAVPALEGNDFKHVNSTVISANGASNVESIENSPKEVPAPQPVADFENTQPKLDVSLNKSFEISSSTSQPTNNEETNLDSSSTETASEVTADLTQATIATTSPNSIHSSNTSQNVVEESELKKSTMQGMQAANKSLNSSHNALNLTIDINTSTNSSKSSASSPGFPIKHKGSLKQFPHSPTADASKSVPFLEKSEYTERIEIERKRSTTSEPKQTLLRSRKTSAVDEKIAPEKDISNNTSGALQSTEIAYADTSSTGVDAIVELNATFDGGATISIADAVLKDVNLTDSLNKRRTFNLPAPAVTEETEHAAQNDENERDKRRTFNMANVEEKEVKLTKESKIEEKRRTFNVAAPISMPNTSNHEDLNISMDIDETLPPVTSVADNENSTKPIQTTVQSPTTTAPISPPIPTLQKNTESTRPLSTSPPIPTLQNRPQVEKVTDFMAPICAMQTAKAPTSQLHMDDDAFKVPLPPSPASSTASPPLPIIKKRPSIHAYKNTEDAAVEVLSAKEQTKRDASDEKDVFAGNCTPSPMEEQPSSTSGFDEFVDGFNVDLDQQEFANEQFESGNNLIFNPSDFDYLLTKGNNSAPIDRSSILLKFDPLLGLPVPVNQIQQQPAKQSPQILQQILANNKVTNLSPTIEEDEHSLSSSISGLGKNQSFVAEADNKRISLGLSATKEESVKSTKQQYTTQVSTEKQQVKEQKLQQQQQQPVANLKKHASMSVDVIKDMNIDNDCNKSFENSNSQPDEKQINYKMDELEKKIRNEVLKTEDIEKKLKEAEQREEALIKRITEKDKAITKMTDVIEAYEKAIAELIAEKEQLIQSYEKQLAEVKADRDSNYQHLTSLETTFADLHVKYGKSKEMTLQLKSNEESLVAEKRQILENLRLQEQRYDKMKNHAMQQLEIANKKLESLNKEHSIESTKLKALLKKEEISRASINEQLQQKSRENAELVKICDELINGQGS